AKYHKLKYGTELNQGDMKPPSYDSDEANENDSSGSLNNQLSWKHGRQLLRQYLQEVGYTDTILDVKSQRVRALLGLAGDGAGKTGERMNTEPSVNGPNSTPKGMGTRGKVELSDTSAVLEAFKFIENAAVEFSDEDEEEDSDGKERTNVESRTIVRKKPSTSSSSSPASMDTSEDPDTEEALKGFDFLSNSDEMDNSSESRGTGDGTDWGPNRSKLQDMLANLRDAEDLSHMQPPSTPQSRPNVARFSEHEGNRTDEAEALTFPPTPGKSFIMGTDEGMESVLGLGELAGLTVANEADSMAYDIGNNKDAMRKTWNPKFTLRSHFDGIRALTFHPVEPVLITASEDHTLKMWNLQKTAPAKK
ncbi:hypothetical protein XENOCAPTIV_003127, partial [Xenoophorus captivus]